MMNYPTRSIGGHVVHYVGKVCDHAVDHVIPHGRNNGCPHALRHRVLLGYSLVLILVKALAIAIPIALPAASLYSSAITSTNILVLTNAARTTAGLPALGMNTMLSSAAQAKAASMLEEQYFAHQSPDGRMPWNFIRSTGYTYQHAGENLAVHFQQAEDVHAGWMASPTHRANILDNRYTEIGVGVSSGNFEGVPAIFVVQMFGTPMTQPTQPTQPTAPVPTPAEETPVAAAQQPTPEPQPASEPVSTPEPTPEPASTPVTFVPPSEPVVEPAPEPAADPITEPTAESVTEPTTEEPARTPTINVSSASITPIPTGYRVSVHVQDAQTVSMAMGASTAPLDPDPAGTGTWYGVIAKPIETAQGSALTAIATGESGAVSTAVLATLTPAETPQDLFLFNQSERVTPKVFGIVDLGHFNDNAKRFYAYVSVLLAALLLTAIAFKFHKQHPTVLAHGTGVLALTILLGMI